MTDVVLGLDIGTTSTQAVALAPPDRVLAEASRPVALSSPHPGWAEQDPEQWWANSCAALAEVMAAIPDAAPAGLCVTGMLPAVVLLDAEGRLLRPSIQQSDGRCGREVADLAAELDAERFVARTGNGINQQLVAAKLRWIARHEPEIFARIATVFGSYDYINWRLTGRRAVEQNWALEAGFTDLATDAIAPDLVALAGVAVDVVPPRSVSHEIMGSVTAEASAATGLPKGLPVFGGAADHIVSALVAGVASPGDVLLKYGGAGDVVVASDRARPDQRLFLDYHLVPGLYAPNGCMAASGAALNWLASLIGPDAQGRDAHIALDTAASRIPPGADGVLCLPYFLGEKTPIHDPAARGTITGLSLSHGPGYIWRAALEAVAYGFAHHLEVLAEIGHESRRVLASDGGTNSALWMQITADVLQMPVQVMALRHGSCLGAAAVAGVGTGLIGDWAQAGRLARAGQRFEPDPALAGVYARGYRDYRALYGALAPVFRSRAGDG